MMMGTNPFKEMMQRDMLERKAKANQEKLKKEADELAATLESTTNTAVDIETIEEKKTIRGENSVELAEATQDKKQVGSPSGA